MSRFASVFPAERPLIGMMALPPSPGYPSFTTFDAYLAAALADLEALEEGGADAALVENDFDQPHALVVSTEVVAAMTRATRDVVTRASLPVGVQVLIDDWRASIAVAVATGARFVRLDFFVDRVETKYGLVEPDPAAVLAYRASLDADDVLVLADIQVKYSTVVDGPKPIERSACEAAAAGADAIVVTGSETGIGPSEDDLRAARAGGVPVLIGSGLSVDNAARLVPLADGFIVGTSLRSGRGPHDRVVRDRVADLVRAIRSA